MLPPELARDHAAVVAAAAAAAEGMNPLAGLNSLSPAGLAYARAAMVCLSVTLSVCLSLCTLSTYTVSHCLCTSAVRIFEILY